MMGRILRIELRRSPAMFIALLSIVIGTALLLAALEMFAGRWMQLAVSTRLMLVVLLPLALAGGAWLGRRDARYRVNELFASTVRPRWQRVLPTAAAFAIAVVTAYVVVFLAGAALVVPSGYFPVTAIVVAAVGALSLIAAGWLGMAAGRAVPRLVTAPALAVVGAALAGVLPLWLAAPWSTRVPSAVLLTPVHDGNIDDFQTIVARVNLAQALWLAALAVTGLLLLAVVRRRTIALAVLPAALGAAIAVPLLPAGGYKAAAAFDPAAVELVCDNDGPQVCMTRVHSGLLPDIVGPARQALTMLAAKLPNAPTRAVEDHQVVSWARSSQDPAPARHPANTLVFDISPIGSTARAEFADQSFRSLLLEAAWQQDCRDNATDPQTQRDDEYIAVKVVAAWIDGQPTTLQKLHLPEDRKRAESAYQALTGVPQAEQKRRIAQARDAALACRPDALASILSQDTP
jgi:hypothetical protein